MRNEKFIYSGKETDAETGLSYFGARYYDPATAIWYGVDILVEEHHNMGGYVYCNNNPILLYDLDGKSGRIAINAETKTVTVTSKLYFYGSKATPELSGEIATGIASQWNGAKAKTTIDGAEYKVQFKIYYETVSTDKAKKLAKCNTDLKNNFVRVEEGEGSSFTLNNSSGGNSFWFNTKDELGSSTTASHEYGHGFGMAHPKEDLSGATERPHILIPRNTEYGENWSIQNGNGKRVVNPNSRRVTQQNGLDALKTNGGAIHNIIINEDGTY